MKCISIIAICFLPLSVMARTGSVVVYFISQDEITVAADSRITNTLSGAHEDTYCKIRAFGDHFVVAVAGITQGDRWSSPDIAKHVWKAEQNGRLTPEEFANEVANGWLSRVQAHLQNQREISQARRELEGGVVTYALFGATDSVGRLAAARATIAVDLALFDSKHIVHLIPKLEPLQLGSGGTLGLGEIANEYYKRTTSRADQYMKSYLATIASQPAGVHDASLASMNCSSFEEEAYIGSS